MNDLLVVGTASLDVLHFGEKTVYTAGGAGMYTALAARRHSEQVTLFGPRPAPSEMPDELQPIAARLDWQGPITPLDQLPRLEIRQHGGGKATLVGASWGAETSFAPADLPEDVSNFYGVHIAALSSAQRQLDFLRACRARGAQRVSIGTYAKIAYGETATVRQLCRAADWCFMNENEAKGVFGDIDSAQAQLRPGQSMCITLAERGALLLAEGRQTLLPAPAAIEVDPTGAGDTFCGTFLALLAQGNTLSTCGTRAIQAASGMIGYVGPAGLLL